jgi:predicted ATPase/DNA-binding SARP family transcriptional activator
LQRRDNGRVEAVEIRVLGPLELARQDRSVRLTAEKQRRLLAALAAQGGACSTDTLIDALWGASPPTSAEKLLQVYVSQLRKLLDPALIRRRGSTYALEHDGGSLDAVRFERLVEEGKAASKSGNPALAASLLRRGLALWRGRAYGEFAYEDFARGDAERLEELRLAALEELFEAELALGRHTDLLPEVCSLAAEHPLRERLQAQAMLALYRCRRQSEALDVYAALRARLHDELGLEPSRELRDLQRRILQHDSDLASATPAAGMADSLPVPPNQLLGRERELQELRALLVRDEVRLLVLTGAGGSGKTRLALEAARQSAPSFANSAAFVSLAGLRDAEPVLGAIARVVGLEEMASDALETLAEALRPRELLLVLDNAEQLRAIASIFVELLARAPRLTLLVTSRVVLHLSGEHVYPVEPLEEEPALALFVERGREAEPRFHPDIAAKEAIRRICSRLDRLPLAIELAASRVRTLRPVELLARLEPCLPLLVGGARDLPTRQQTLRATVSWSVDLLDSHEQRDLARLTVFAGGCTLDAAESVCGTTLERISALIDHNLLRWIDGGSGSRYSMLETIREFAHERLEASGESAALRRRHAEFFLTVAESANLMQETEEHGERRDLVAEELQNFQAALEWTADNDCELGLAIAVALEGFWNTHSPFEGVRWFDALLEPARNGPPELLARALRAYGGVVAIVGDNARAERLFERSLAAFNSVDDKRGIGHLLLRLGASALYRQDYERARRLAADSLAIARDVNDRRTQALALGLAGEVAYSAGDREVGLELVKQSAAFAGETGYTWQRARMLRRLADWALQRKDIDGALSAARESVRLAQRTHDRIAVVLALARLAQGAADSGRREQAGRLWGAIEAEEQRAPVAAWQSAFELVYSFAEHDRQLSVPMLVNADADFDRGRYAGHALSLNEAVAEGLSQPDPTVQRPIQT